MMYCGMASAVALAAFACFAYVLLSGMEQQQPGGEEGTYELGSGRMFDAIAPRYDMINKVMSLGLDMGWRRAMIEGLELRAGDRVVDLATGTADVAIMIAGELVALEGSGGPGTTEPDTGSHHPVIGIDPSTRMLDVGRQKAVDAGLSSRVKLQIGDARDLADISDGSVDKLTMAFGIRNVPDRMKALREIRRVMANAEPPQPSGEVLHISAGKHPDREKRTASSECASTEQQEGEARGGDVRGESPIVAILELQHPESGPLALGSRAFIRYGAPLLGAMMSGSGAEYLHLKKSILNFPTVSEWIELMAEAGEG